MTQGIPGSAGVPGGCTKDTLTAAYNDLDSVRALFEANPNGIAAVIVEPVGANMGVVLPVPGFLQGLRDICDANGALLIFDEVISGFRAALGGAQERFGIRADLCTFGKIIGGGFPVGCVAGRADLMEQLAPTGPVYQAGTLSGNPVAMEAGIATLTQLMKSGVYEELERKGTLLASLLRDAIAATGVPACVNQVGSLATIFFNPGPVTCWDDAAACDTDAFARYFRSMLDAGFLIAPSQFEALFVSLAHSYGDIERFGIAARAALSRLA
jgi:glutamate-1-semialdehyde 2,1-aminomutase